MDSYYFGQSVAGLSYSSYSDASSITKTPFRSFKFDSRNSVSEIPDGYRDSQETNSLTNSMFQATSLSNSSLDYSNYFQQSGPSPFCLQDSLLVHSNGPSFLQTVNDNQHIRRSLQELENVLMAADDHEQATTSEPFSVENMQSQALDQQGHVSSSLRSESPCDSWFPSSSNGVLHVKKRHKAMNDITLSLPPSSLKQLLIACARALSENKLDEFKQLVEHARAAVSINGEPIQRLGAYIIEGLIARKDSSGSNIYQALKCKEPDSKDLLSYMQILYEICPYLKFGYMAANGAIAEACKTYDHIHIIDFQIAQGTQWMTLLQALASRPGGAPHVRITGIDDPVSKYARGDGLAAVGRRFAAISEKFNIPVEFHAVPVFAPDITREMLKVRLGEALAVNFPLQLHHTPDESVDVFNPRDGLLRMVKSLSPKVVTLVEQESNTNTAPFLPRFIETLDYYSAMFESIDVTMPRDRKERVRVEQHCLARDIVNVVACEGAERLERHELLGKWKSRFMMAGFGQLPLSSYVNSVIRGLLRCYSEHYTLVEKDGAMLLGWKDRNLISASAWC